MSIGAENINPYDGDNRAKGEQVMDMFDNIAPRYDFMNRTMTLSIDKQWRRKAVLMVKTFRDKSRSTPFRILDVATGTADLAIKMAREIGDATVTGIDLSEEMVKIGISKVNAARLGDRIDLLTGDCLSLPFDDNSFDCVSVAFGVRNFENLRRGYSEMLRVLRPGGMLCVIELSEPTSGFIRSLYRLYSRHIIPGIGRLVSKDKKAYTYLPASIEAVPQGTVMTKIMEETGFRDTACRTLTFGVCSIYTGYKPQQ